MTRWATALVMLVLIGMGAALPAWAHKASDSYLNLGLSPGADGSAATLEQRWDIALRDLDRELALDADFDSRLTWGEVRAGWPQLQALAEAALRLQTEGARCEPGPWAEPLLDEHSDGRYAVLQRRWTCDRAPAALQVHYTLFAAADPTHRGIVRIRHASGSALGVLGGERPAQRFGLSGGSATDPAASRQASAPDAGGGATRGAADPAAADAVSDSPGFGAFLREGVHHILIGTDHVLFLLALLLPAVVMRQATGGEPVPLRRVLVGIVKVVTAFTVAHSITLSLAALDVVDPPSRWVESIIAASVVFAALDNLRVRPLAGRWTIAFAFGLVHGFGFAGVLKDLGLGGGEVLAPLVGFNLGVELGQLLIVALFVPLAWALRDTRLYRVGVLRGGSLAIAGLALMWLAERALDLEIPGL
jgi:hypothetical protein